MMTPLSQITDPPQNPGRFTLLLDAQRTIENDAQACVNGVDSNQETPLSLALKYAGGQANLHKVIERLLQAGAFTNGSDSAGQTALQIALKYAYCHPQLLHIVMLFLRSGASVGGIGLGQPSALHYALGWADKHQELPGLTLALTKAAGQPLLPWNMWDERALSMLINNRPSDWQNILLSCLPYICSTSRAELKAFKKVGIELLVTITQRLSETEKDIEGENYEHLTAQQLEENKGSLLEMLFNLIDILTPANLHESIHDSEFDVNAPCPNAKEGIPPVYYAIVQMDRNATQKLLRKGAKFRNSHTLTESAKILPPIEMFTILRNQFQNNRALSASQQAQDFPLDGLFDEVWAQRAFF